MAKTKLIPGFRFHPTGVELVKYFLKRKVMGKKFYGDVIAELDIYKYAPWDLPDKSHLRTGDLEWYFFCAREKKYGSGVRMNRATDIGYWKTTGKDRTIQQNNETVGMIKTLIFHIGKAPHGERTNWVMHEYRLEDKELAGKGIAQDSYVICKVFQKEGVGPRNGAQYGKPFSEEDWDDEDVGIPFASFSASSPILPMTYDSSVPNDIHLPYNGCIVSTSTSCLSGPMLSPGPTNPSHLAMTYDRSVPNDKPLPDNGCIGSTSTSCLSGSMLSPGLTNPSHLAVTSESYVPNDKQLPVSDQVVNNDEDILSMLDLFKEDEALPKEVDNPGKENIAEGEGPSTDFFEGLGDPDYWAAFDGFNSEMNAEITTNGMATSDFGDLEFIELIDLDSPDFWQTTTTRHP